MPLLQSYIDKPISTLLNQPQSVKLLTFKGTVWCLALYPHYVAQEPVCRGPFLHWPHSQLQLDVRPFDLDMYFDSFFFLAFYCDSVLESMVSFVKRQYVMSTYHPHNCLMSTAKGECNNTLSHVHTLLSNKPWNTCAHRHPGGPITWMCLKPTYLLENQSCCAPGPLTDKKLE